MHSPSVFHTMLPERTTIHGEAVSSPAFTASRLLKTQHRNGTHFCPNHRSSAFSATHTIPSYTTSLESATALHQNGGASTWKFLTVARATRESVNATGRPSPSRRVAFPYHDHQSWPLPTIPPVRCASIVKSRPVTTNQEAWSWMNMTR